MKTRTPESSSAAVWTATDLAGDPHRSPQKAERVRRMFAAIARCYDRNNRIHSLGLDQVWRRRAVEMAGITHGDAVLDVACGTGDLTEAFASAGPASLVGLDFTEPMLEIARRKAQRRRRPASAPAPRYVHGDALDLPFEDASVDVVSIAFGIRNVSDPSAALREFHRVLRPGGRVIILEFTQPRNRVLRALNGFYTCRILPRTAALIGGDRSGAYRYLPRSIDTFLTEQEMTAALRAAGFEHVQVRPMTFGVCAVWRALRLASLAQDRGGGAGTGADTGGDTGAGGETNVATGEA